MRVIHVIIPWRRFLPAPQTFLTFDPGVTLTSCWINSKLEAVRLLVPVINPYTNINPQPDGTWVIVLTGIPDWSKDAHLRRLLTRRSWPSRVPDHKRVSNISAWQTGRKEAISGKRFQTFDLALTRGSIPKSNASDDLLAPIVVPYSVERRDKEKDRNRDNSWQEKLQKERHE